MMASDGQTSTQVWQSTHMSLSTFAFSFSSEIADDGHSFTHVSQPVHFSKSTIATKIVHSILFVLLKTKKGFRYDHGGLCFRQIENIAHTIDARLFADYPA